MIVFRQIEFLMECCYRDQLYFDTLQKEFLEEEKIQINVIKYDRCFKKNNFANNGLLFYRYLI